MTRVKFNKEKQREFLINVLKFSNCPNLRELTNRGFDISYDCLKNYYSERRLMDLEFFEKLCIFSGLNKKGFNYVLLESNWGQVKGGRNRKKNKTTKVKFK